MQANTIIHIKDGKSIKVEEELNHISNDISTNNYNSFPFIEITEILERGFKSKKMININFIKSYEAII